MGSNVRVGKQPKVLVVGYLGYHENTIVQPILKHFQSYHRICGNMDFFLAENEKDMIRNWTEGLDKISLSDFDLVLCVDFWNMTLPFLIYKKSTENKDIKIVGILHGTVNLSGDVALEILHAFSYESFLLDAYDKIIVHSDWIKDLFSSGNIIVSQHPLDHITNSVRPIVNHRKRVIYPHRWNEDKGKDLFLEFAELCIGSDMEFIATVEEKLPFNITSTGRLDQRDLKGLCNKGGYVWSSAKSEMVGYAVWDLMSYGLTPLVNMHPAYDYIPDRYRYSSLLGALDIVMGGCYMSNEEWNSIVDTIEPSKNIAMEILND